MLRLLLLSLLLFSTLASAQLTVYGRILDSLTAQPVPFANVQVKGMVKGAVADENGAFKLTVDSLPVTLVVTCVGFRTTEVRIDKAYTLHTIRIAPAPRALKEVVISSQPLKCIQKDLSLMAADFQFYDNYLLVLAHRDIRSPSRLMLLDESGNNISTLYVSKEMSWLFRDCFGNVHVQTKDSSWQVYYDYTKLQLIHPTTVREMENYLFDCELFFAGRIFMRFHSFHSQRCTYMVGANGLHTRFHYACDTVGVQRIQTNYDLNYFLTKRKRGEGYNYSVRFMKNHLMELQAGVDIQGKDASSLSTLNAPIVFHDSAVWIFQFEDNVALRFNEQLLVSDSVPLLFHHTRDWTGDLYRDEITDELYTTFLWDGWLRICRLNTETFVIENEIILAETPFPTELKIRNGVAYFLWLDRKEVSGNRMLYRYYL